jgi:tetratricopeptide (TPR) repeat protein
MDDEVSKIGRYIILGRIGSGGFATVYRVRDSNLDREVALKVMRPLLLSDPNFVARFEQEARVVANLDHPNIVPIYDYGDIEDRLCLVMKLLPGGSLADLLEAGALPWQQVVSLAAQVASALDYAHERGLVHRDIKPENVLLDEKGNAVLADFGLVRALESGRLTTSLSGGVLGTPAYVAPEVWNGDAGTRSTDVYGLACLVYEMITGAQLFDAPTPPATMTLHFRPPQFPPQWPEDTPPGIERVLRQALAHDPEERYPSAGAFAAALAELADDPLAAPYEALQAALAERRWPDAVALAESILERGPGYRDTAALLSAANAARAEADRATWAAQWQAEAEQALAAGDWQRALSAARRWQEFAPEDVAAAAAIERARTGLEPVEEAVQREEPAAGEPVVEQSAFDEPVAPEGSGVLATVAGAARRRWPRIGQQAERGVAMWAAHWQAKAESALEAGQWQRALTSAKRWQSFVPEDAAAKAAVERAQNGLEREAAIKLARDVPADGAPATPSGGRRRTRAILLVAAALLVVAVAVVAADAIIGTLGAGAPAGDIEEAAELSGDREVMAALGTTYDGALADDQVDRYFLSELGTPIALVEVTPENGLDVVLVAYDGDSNELQRVDESGAGGTEWLIVRPGGGTVAVSAFQAGSYRLVMVPALEPGSSARLTGGVMSDGDWHDFPFDAPAGSDVAAVTEAGFDLTLELWHDEEVIEERDNGDGHEQLLYHVVDAGSYAFTVRAQEGSGEGYRLLLLSRPSVFHGVALGDEIIGAFAPDMVFDYALALEPGMTVSLNAAPDLTQADIALEVKDANGNELARVDDGDDGGSENLTFMAPEDGDGAVVIRLSELNGLDSGHFHLLIGQGSAEQVDVDTSRFVSELTGLRFDYPDSWAVTEGDFDPFVVALASDTALLEELINDPDAAFQGALVVFQTGDAADLGGESLETVLGEMPPFTDLAGEGEVTEAPTGTTVRDEEAATASVELDAPDGTRYGARFVLIRAAGRFVLVLALAPLEQFGDYEPLLEVVLQSLELRRPLEQAGQGGIAVGDTTHEELAPGTFHAWHLAGSEGQHVHIIVEPGEGFDVMVDVRGERVRSILDGGRVDDAGEGDAETVEVTFPADGEYLIYILGYEGSFGPYTLSVEPGG